MITFAWRIVAMTVAISACAFAAEAKNRTVGGASMSAKRTIVDNAAKSKDHKTLAAAIKAAGLVETLKGRGPFTVFAPTDDAFAALPGGIVAMLLRPENKATLARILTCHVVATKTVSKTIAKMIREEDGVHPIRTMGGCIVDAKRSKGVITLTDERGGVAHVTIADVTQSNGVVHVIDKVLLPKL